jgi:hypothetical protein
LCPRECKEKKQRGAGVFSTSSNEVVSKLGIVSSVKKTSNDELPTLSGIQFKNGRRFDLMELRLEELTRVCFSFSLSALLLVLKKGRTNPLPFDGSLIFMLTTELECQKEAISEQGKLLARTSEKMQIGQ